MGNGEVIKYVIQGKQISLEEIDGRVHSLIQNCIQYNPNQRPTFLAFMEQLEKITNAYPSSKKIYDKSSDAFEMEVEEKTKDIGYISSENDLFIYLFIY